MLMFNVTGKLSDNIYYNLQVFIPNFLQICHMPRAVGVHRWLMPTALSVRTFRIDQHVGLSTLEVQKYIIMYNFILLKRLVPLEFSSNRIKMTQKHTCCLYRDLMFYLDI